MFTIDTKDLEWYWVYGGSHYLPYKFNKYKYLFTTKYPTLNLEATEKYMLHIFP